MKRMAISEARRNFADVVDSPETTVITVNGEAEAVVLDYNLYRAMKADLDLLTSPGAIALLRQHREFQDEHGGEPARTKTAESDEETGEELMASGG